MLIPNGKEKIGIGKNSRFKNYEIFDKLRAKKAKLPVYYVGEWNGDKQIWLGNLVSVNPNRVLEKGK